MEAKVFLVLRSPRIFYFILCPAAHLMQCHWFFFGFSDNPYFANPLGGQNLFFPNPSHSLPPPQTSHVQDNYPPYLPHFTSSPHHRRAPLQLQCQTLGFSHGKCPQCVTCDFVVACLRRTVPSPLLPVVCCLATGGACLVTLANAGSMIYCIEELSQGLCEKPTAARNFLPVEDHTGRPFIAFKTVLSHLMTAKQCRAAKGLNCFVCFCFSLGGTIGMAWLPLMPF